MVMKHNQLIITRLLGTIKANKLAEKPAIALKKIQANNRGTIDIITKQKVITQTTSKGNQSVSSSRAVPTRSLSVYQLRIIKRNYHSGILLI